MTKSKKVVIIVVAIILILAVIALGVLGGVYGIFDYCGNEIFDVSAEPYGNDIVVMSFNIRRTTINDLGKRSWFHRAELVIAAISQHSPDIIGFQEMTPFQEKYLKKHLSGYSFLSVYRDDARSSEAPGIAFRADRFEEIERGSFWLSATPEKMSKSWNSAYYRNANYLILRDKATGKEFSYCNTHLDNVSEEARINGSNVVISKMAERDLPAVITGDFNAEPYSPAYLNMINSGFTDAQAVVEAADLQKVTFHNYGGADAAHLDYCFVKNISQVVSCRIFDRPINGDYPSDHFPLVIKLTI